MTSPLDRAADLFMEIGFSETGWSTALEALNTALDAACTVVLPIYNRRPGFFPMTASAAEPMKGYVSQGILNDDYRMISMPILKKRGITVDQDIVKPEDMRKIAYYQEFLASYNLFWFVGIRVMIGNELSAISVQRSALQGPFLPSEQSDILSVSHRITNGIAQASRMADSIANGITDFYSASPVPIVCLDRNGAIIQFNKAAEQLLGADLQIRNNQLQVSKLDSQKLRDFVDALVAFDRPEPVEAAKGLMIRRPSQRPLVLFGQRLQIGAAWSYFSRARAIVKIIDPETSPKSDLELISSYLNLSGSEAKAAVALYDADGSVVRAAEILGVTHNTIRSYLKAVYAKTDINSASRLIQMIDRILLHKGLL